MGDVPRLFVHKSALYINTDLHRMHDNMENSYLLGMAKCINKKSDWIC